MGTVVTDSARLFGCIKESSIGAVIRFKNSIETLPQVLAALKCQSVTPTIIVGVNDQSTDGSRDLMQSAGAKVFDWDGPYGHAQTLNFALRQCPTDLVLILSSHTVLTDRDALEKMAHALADPLCACASGKWDDDAGYSDSVTWGELKANGMRFVSIYSNSFGLLRRKFWEEAAFDESLPTMEDYAWALEQVKRGRICRRVGFRYNYLREGPDRHRLFAEVAFRLASRHGLRLVWLGPRETLRRGLVCVLKVAFQKQSQAINTELRLHRDRFAAWLTKSL